ncbi:MAG: P-loop NTPase [Pseudomonadota bacterium]
MMISIASGKGGTGKTTVATNLALSLGPNVQLLDCDVEEPNAHLFIRPTWESVEAITTPVPEVDNDKCTLCGKCGEICQFKAILVIGETVLTFPELCHSCGGCMEVCPEKAIEFPINTCGEWFISDTRFGPMVHARLGIAEENSGKLVNLVRQQAKKLAEERNAGLILTDGPPGVGCPVIASIGGASVILIVTEPTVSGKHDMVRVAQLVEHFKVPGMICVNKFDLNPNEAKIIEDVAVDKDLTVMGRVPFDPVFTKAMVQGQTIFEYDGQSEAGVAVMEIWLRIKEKLQL